MIKQESSGSLYDFVGEGHEAPQQPKRERLAGQFANREDMSKPYNNKNGQPQHVKDAMRITQKDNSYYAFQRFAFKRPALDAFEQEVNKAFGVLREGFEFIPTRETYMSFYREMMNNLD